MRTQERRNPKMADELQATQKQELKTDTGELTREGTYFAPAVDIYGNEKELVLLADKPGVSSDNVEIDLRDNVLTILGKMQTEDKGEELLSEYRTGNYYRNFRVTDVIDQTKISASMSDGVLKLVMPKAEKAVPKKIPISNA